MVGRAGTGLIPLPAASAGRWMRSTGGSCVRGARVPAERTLAAAAGVLRRRQGSVT